MLVLANAPEPWPPLRQDLSMIEVEAVIRRNLGRRFERPSKFFKGAIALGIVVLGTHESDVLPLVLSAAGPGNDVVHRCSTTGTARLLALPVVSVCQRTSGDWSTASTERDYDHLTQSHDRWTGKDCASAGV